MCTVDLPVPCGQCLHSVLGRTLYIYLCLVVSFCIQYWGEHCTFTCALWSVFALGTGENTVDLPVPCGQFLHSVLGRTLQTYLCLVVSVCTQYFLHSLGLLEQFTHPSSTLVNVTFGLLLLCELLCQVFSQSQGHLETSQVAVKSKRSRSNRLCQILIKTSNQVIGFIIY